MRLIKFVENLASLDFLELLDRLPDLCLFHRITGLRCPGCGMTHALVSLSRGDFQSAFYFNPFCYLLLLMLLCYLLKIGRKPKLLKLSILGALVIYGFSRNL
ncbi:MAG: DUF2752 domain-containing protein [Oligoflexia bacterium]|nr:DUF2752 domain-containing protein [Oligoflexia bacterium]MBF0366147.1 DUF2752 domain-containing protein [Oligoflexia bacterium]